VNLRNVTGLALLCLVASTACQTGPKYKPAWTDAVVSAPSENVLWAVASQELQRMGYPLGSGAHPDQLVMTSAWKTELAPFKGDGFREKAQVRFTRQDNGQYKVEARVQRESNQDMVRPIDPSYAEWEEAPDNVDAARVLLQRIQARISEPLEVGRPKPTFPKR